MNDKSFRDINKSISRNRSNEERLRLERLKANENTLKLYRISRKGSGGTPSDKTIPRAKSPAAPQKPVRDADVISLFKNKEVATLNQTKLNKAAALDRVYDMESTDCSLIAAVNGRELRTLVMTKDGGSQWELEEDGGERFIFSKINSKMLAVFKPWITSLAALKVITGKNGHYHQLPFELKDAKFICAGLFPDLCVVYIKDAALMIYNTEKPGLTPVKVIDLNPAMLGTMHGLSIVTLRDQPHPSTFDAASLRWHRYLSSDFSSSTEKSLYDDIKKDLISENSKSLIIVQFQQKITVIDLRTLKASSIDLKKIAGFTEIHSLVSPSTPSDKSQFVILTDTKGGIYKFDQDFANWSVLRSANDRQFERIKKTITSPRFFVAHLTNDYFRDYVLVYDFHQMSWISYDPLAFNLKKEHLETDQKIEAERRRLTSISFSTDEEIVVSSLNSGIFKIDLAKKTILLLD